MKPEIRKTGMRPTLIPWVLLLFLAFVPTSSQGDSSERTLALTHLTIIDGTGSPPKPDMTILIRAGRIAVIGPSSSTALPIGANIVNGKGKFLIPGLWDMHAHPHLNSREFFPFFAHLLYLSNGVTGLRDMFGPLEVERQWRRGISVGALPGPRMYLAGPLVDGPQPSFPGAIGVATGEEGRNAVRTLKKRGSDFIKVYDLLPREAYFAIADEAKKQGMVFCGHVPASITAQEASKAGQKSIEHLTDVAVSCSTEETALRKALAEALTEKDLPIVIRKLTEVETRALETYSPEKCRKLASEFVRNETWHDPTLVTLRVPAFANDPEFLKDDRLRYFPLELIGSWNPQTGDYLSGLNDDTIHRARRAFPTYLRLVGDLHKAGVRFLAGTDAPAVPYCFPGFSLHDELKLMVAAGLTPMEALQTATRNPAEYLGIETALGTVQVGKMADLVLLDENPLEDIGNTSRVRATISRGILYPRERLDDWLSEISEAAAKSPNP